MEGGRWKAEGGTVQGGRCKAEGGRWKAEGTAPGDRASGLSWNPEGGRQKVEGGRWKVEGGRWKMVDSEKWTVEEADSRGWKVEGGRWNCARWKVEGRKWKGRVEGVNYRCGSVSPVCEDRARRRQARAYTSSEPVLTRYSRQAESMGPPHATATFHSIGTLGGLGAAGASRASTTDANPLRLYAKTAPVDGKLAHTRAPSPS